MNRPALAVLQESLDDPWGKISPSYYDTAHVVRAWARSPQRVPSTLAEPALSFLLRHQNPDGYWGWVATPHGYRLVPTLAACAALSAVVRADVGAEHRKQARRALARGLDYLVGDLRTFGPDELPDTVAVEYIVPALFEELHENLSGDDPRRARLDSAMRPFESWRELLRSLRDAVRGGRAIPVQRNHCWELFDSIGNSPPPFQDGSIVCSPAATAAALSRVDAAEPAVTDYLSVSPPRLDGAQPVVLPLIIFERAWIVTGMMRSGCALPSAVRQKVIDNFRPFWTPEGVGAAPGLAIEADDTAGYLLALLFAGANVELDCLLAYEEDVAFRTYHSAERNTSISTNAHVLEVFTAGTSRQPDLSDRFGPPARKARDFLLDAQHADGYWEDKWHASPYYATSCAVFGLGAAPGRTREWLLETQRDDGSWGRWCGTLEETVYALQVLIRVDGTSGDAVRRGWRFLDEARWAESDDSVHTPLWHSKELYSPIRVVEGLASSVLVGR